MWLLLEMSLLISGCGFYEYNTMIPGAYEPPNDIHSIASEYVQFRVYMYVVLLN